MADNDRSLLDLVKDAVMTHTRDQSGVDTSGLLSHITDLFTKHAPEHAGVRPASEDPYGDPAESQRRFGNVKPASEDPYGDPADQEQRRRTG